MPRPPKPPGTRMPCAPSTAASTLASVSVSLRSLIEEHQSMIDLRKTERGEHDNVTYLRRRAASDA